MRCDIDCASSFNLAKSTKYDSKTNGKKSIFQCMRAQAGELSQIPKMSLLEKLHEIPGILGGWYLNVPGSTNGFFNPLAYLHGKKIRTPIWGYIMRTPSLIYLGYTAVSHSTPSRLNQRPINVESFQAHHPSRENQPRAFTSDSIQALVTP